MNGFVNMLSPLQWLVMAAIPPLIIMLYFLKLRRTPMVVPSTYLWQRSIEDLHVNSIWQRLRQNILLLLQLLAVLALILACLRPGMRGTEKLGDRSIFMIDNSSSMRATDLGQSRLEFAKERALEMISGLSSSDVGMVIAFSDRADIRQGFTSDKKKLRAAIGSIEPTSRTTDLNEALRAAAGLANPGRTSQIDDIADIQVAEARPASMYILSDGGFGVPQLDLENLSAEYIPIGSDAPQNVAILAFTVERNLEDDGQIEAFARVHNFGDQPVETTASLSLDGEFMDASNIAIDPNSSTGVSFSLADLGEGRMRLEIDVADDLDVDNVAFAGLDAPRQLEVVLVTAGNSALEAALSTGQASALATVRVMDPAAMESPEAIALAQAGTVDLYIYDACSPLEMPASNTLFLGALPPGDAWTASEPSGPVFVIDVNRAHPMLQYVDMGTVRIVEGTGLEMPQGGTELLRSDAGVLVGVAPREAYQDAVVGLTLLKRSGDDVVPNTDWPIKRSFPVFMLNALEYLGGAVSTASSRTVKPGEGVALSMANRFDKVEIFDPSGRSKRVDRTGQPQLVYTQTETPGFYEAKVAGEDRLLQLFTVNLFSEQESDILPKLDVMIGAQTIKGTTAATEIVRVEYWRWLLGLALVILSLEWLIYNRRIAV